VVEVSPFFASFIFLRIKIMASFQVDTTSSLNSNKYQKKFSEKIMIFFISYVIYKNDVHVRMY
jgi:hypothetical protein